MKSKSIFIVVAMAMLLTCCQKDEPNTINLSELKSLISKNVSIGNNLLINIYNFKDEYNYANYSYNNDSTIDEYCAMTACETMYIGKFNYLGSKPSINVIDDQYDNKDQNLSTIEVLPTFNNNGFLSQITIKEKIVENYKGEVMNTSISDNYIFKYNSNNNLIAVSGKYKVSSKYMGVTQNETVTTNTNIEWKNGCAVSSTTKTSNGKYNLQSVVKLTYDGNNPNCQNTFALNEISNLYYLCELQLIGLIGKGTTKLPSYYSYKSSSNGEEDTYIDSNETDWEIELNENNAIDYELYYEFDYATAISNQARTNNASIKKALPAKQLQTRLRNQAKANVRNKLINKAE